MAPRASATRRGPAPLDLLVAPGAPEHKTQKIEVAAALAELEAHFAQVGQVRSAKIEP